MKKKYMTTYWMDFLTYIVLPLITIIATFNIIRALLVETFTFYFLAMVIIEVLLIGLYVITFINSHNRTKLGYTCFRALVIASTFRAALTFAFSETSGYGTIVSFVGYFALCVAVWVYPNEIYFKNRKELFKNESKINFSKDKLKNKKGNKNSVKKVK